MHRPSFPLLLGFTPTCWDPKQSITTFSGVQTQTAWQVFLMFFRSAVKIEFSFTQAATFWLFLVGHLTSKAVPNLSIYQVQC